MRSKLLTLIVPPALAFTAAAALAQPAQDRPTARQSGPDKTCVDPALDEPVDCVPTTFDTFDIPFAELPGGRMDANGNLDQKSSPEDAHKGAFVAAERLGLFRNFEWVHWVPTAPSKRDAETGEWSGGDLDGFPTGWGSTGLGISGDCLYWGRSNSTNTTGAGVTHEVKIFKIQANPESNPPVEVGSMPQLDVDDGKTAVRDRELRPYQLHVERRPRAHADGPLGRDGHGRRRDHVHGRSAHVSPADDGATAPACSRTSSTSGTTRTTPTASS